MDKKNYRKMGDAVAISIETPQLVQNDVEGGSNDEPNVAQSNNTKEDTSSNDTLPISSNEVEALATSSNVVETLSTSSIEVEALGTSSNGVETMSISLNELEALTTSSNEVESLPPSSTEVEALPTMGSPENGRISSGTAGNAVAMEEEAENTSASNSSMDTNEDTRNIENLNIDAFLVATEGSGVVTGRLPYLADDYTVFPFIEVVPAVQEEELDLSLPIVEISDSDERRRARILRSIRAAAVERSVRSRFRIEQVAASVDTSSERIHNGNGFWNGLLSRFQSAFSVTIDVIHSRLGSLYNRFQPFRTNSRRNQDAPRPRSRSRSRDTRSGSESGSGSRRGSGSVLAETLDESERMDSPIPEYEEMKCILTPPQLKQMNEFLLKIPQHINLFKVNCPVCHCRIHTYRIYSTACGHLFCKRCLMRCLRIKPECPTCRNSLGPEDYHMVYI